MKYILKFCSVGQFVSNVTIINSEQMVTCQGGGQGREGRRQGRRRV